MAGLMSRFTTLFKVKANTMLDKAEDPGQTLDYSYQKQLEMLQKVKRGVADVVTAKKRLQLQTAKLEESIVKLDGQARQALGREPRGPRAHGARAQGADPGPAPGARHADRRARAAAAEPDRPGAAPVGEGRVVPHPEGGREGPVLRGRGAGADRRGDDRPGRGDVRRRASRSQRAQDKTEQMQARAAAVNELVDTGAIDDLTAAAGVGPRRADRGAHRREPGRRRDGQAAGRGRAAALRPPSSARATPSRPSPRRSRNDRRSHPRKRPVPARRRRRGPPERARQRGGRRPWPPATARRSAARSAS